MAVPIRPRRSVLYLPATNAKALAKARTLPVDAVILDLEDAVAPEAKADAREMARAALAEGGWGRREMVIRVNALGSPWAAEDLAMVAASGAAAALAPKVDGPGDIARYHAALGAAPAGMALWAMIETCRAIPALPAIAACASGTRLAVFVMGTNDLAKEMRARLLPGRAPFVPALAATVQAARAHGLAAIDGVCNEVVDMGVFAAEAEQGAEFGFDGKTLIHPAQVDPCNAVFSPGAGELAWADAVIAAFALPENQGKGAIRVEGRMTELLHLEQARRLRAIAEAIAQG